MRFRALCPDNSIWQIVLISVRPEIYVIHLEPLKREARCPLCGTLSQRIHSHYPRHPWDLPWSSSPVQLWITCRRFFCDCPDCPRQIFAESFPKSLKPYARQTIRLQTLLLELAHLGSAEGAARLAKFLGFLTSGDSMIRLERRETCITIEPRVIGVDEFALQKKPEINYGTIIVDEERHSPIDILSSDQMEPVRDWLKNHPGIEIFTRDRDQSYAAAARSAIPEADQVTDRFHLIQNAGTALKTLYKAHTWKMPNFENNQFTVNGSPYKSEVAFTQKTRHPTAGKLTKWEAVKQRSAEGQSIHHIALELGIDRITVRRYISIDTAPVYTPGQYRGTKIGPFLSSLRIMCDSGCHDVKKLYQELNKAGYPGKEGMVRYVLKAWKNGAEFGKLSPPIKSPPPLSHWLLRSRDKLEDEEKTKLDNILELNPSLAIGYRLKERFQKIIREKDVPGLMAWLQEAATSGSKPFQGMVTSIRRDLVAVKNALTLPWSNAQCEGQICRLKLIKRAGYGRAKPDLLRKRVLHRLNPIL
jgi:transposase